MSRSRYRLAMAAVGMLAVTSRTTGLTCKNTVGHGFFLSVQSWRRF